MGAIASTVYALAKRMYVIWMQVKSGLVPSGWLGEQVTTTAEAFGLLAAEIGMYSFLTYPLISMAYGGGHRGAVELLLTQRGAQVAKELSLPMASATSAGPVYILAESDHELVVTTNNSFWPKKQYAQLRKELIEATEAVKTPETTAAAPSTKPASQNGALAPPPKEQSPASSASTDAEKAGSVSPPVLKQTR